MTLGFRSLKALYFVLHNLGIFLFSLFCADWIMDGKTPGMELKFPCIRKAAKKSISLEIHDPICAMIFHYFESSN